MSNPIPTTNPLNVKLSARSILGAFVVLALVAILWAFASGLVNGTIVPMLQSRMAWARGAATGGGNGGAAASTMEVF